MFLLAFQNKLFYYQDINLMLIKIYHYSKNKNIKQLHSGNIKLKFMTQFVTELAKTVYVFSLIADFNVQAMCQFIYLRGILRQLRF